MALRDVGQSICHVVIVDGTGTCVTATRLLGRWILPLVPLEEMVHVETVYPAVLAEFSLDEARHYHLIHCARMEHPTGSAKVHAYCLVQMRGIGESLSSDRWQSIPELLSGLPALPEQAAVLKLAVHRMAHPAAAFDVASTTAAMESWTHQVISDQDQTDGLREIVWRRKARNDAVGTCYTAKGNRVFLKAGSHRAHHEACLAASLNLRRPGSAPSTLALERDRGWWLVADAGGYRLPTSHRTAAWFMAAIETVTTLQRALADDGDVASALAQRPVGASTLANMIPLVLKWGIDQQEVADADTRRALVECRLKEMVDRLASLKSAHYWVNFDLSFENINVLKDGALCIVDLEYGSLGPPLLSFGVLMREAAARGGATTQACREKIVSLWADGDREAWGACLKDLATLTLLLKLHVLRQRFSEYQFEDLGTVDALHAETFKSLSLQIVRHVGAKGGQS